MKIIHRVSTKSTARELGAFEKAGFSLRELGDNGRGVLTFEVDERDSRWPSVALLVKELRAVDIVSTKFTDAELKNAKFLGVLSSWHHGYPQPSDDFGYRELTYDLSEYCESCGIGKRQKAPFRFSAAPTWGRKSILQLNWIFDEYFVKPDVFESVFKPFGIGNRPVLLHRTGAKLNSVVQLEISSMVELEMKDRPFKDCLRCSRRKYSPEHHGFFPAPSGTDSAIFRSTQYLGSGANAFHAVLVSNALYGSIVENNITGIAFQACAGRA
jgi:hypothetical protein